MNEDSPPLRCFVFTCRDARTDFRLPLAAALGRHHETWYIWLRRRPKVLGPNADMATEMSFPALLALLWRVTTTDKLNVYFNTTNTSFPFIILLLKLICGRGVWCFDVHDDLLYDYKGLRRLNAALGIFLQSWSADLMVHAAESLKELFPTSRHLGNASQIAPIERGRDVQVSSASKILVLASFDSRFDFDLMDAIARSCPQLDFDVYGQISQNDPEIAEKLGSLCDRNGNVRHHGAYHLEDLPRILASYSITFAPYRTATRLTRYLDPLRYYHCLNSGMELVTTAIPQAEAMGEFLHIIRSAEEAATLLVELRNGTRPRRAGRYPLQTWEMRADRVIELVLSLPKSKISAASRVSLR